MSVPREASDLCFQTYSPTPHHSHIYSSSERPAVLDRPDVSQPVCYVRIVKLVDTHILTHESNVQADITKTTRGLVCCLQGFVSKCRPGHNNHHFGPDFQDHRSAKRAPLWPNHGSQVRTQSPCSAPSLSIKRAWLRRHFAIASASNCHHVYQIAVDCCLIVRLQGHDG